MLYLKQFTHKFGLDSKELSDRAFKLYIRMNLHQDNHTYALSPASIQHDNVADYVSLPKSQKFMGHSLTEAQVTILLDKLAEQQEPTRAAVVLALMYGLRRS